MRHRILGTMLLVFACGAFAHGQIFSGIKKRLDQVDKATEKLRDLEITEAEEIKIGEDISARIRARYGVAQDPDIHRYVTLVGSVVKDQSSRKDLPYQFIVLDTEGVNAFAAPGGFIHITRGALSLMKDEAQLAGVLAHEIAHVTGRHTMRAIQKGKAVQMASNETSVSSSPALFRRVADEGYKAVMAGFSREDELDADDRGVRTAATTGYEAAGLSHFLSALNQRNAGSEGKQGLFASHPEMEERIQKLEALIKANNWNAGVNAAARFGSRMKYEPVDLLKIVVAEEGAGLTGNQTSQQDEKKKSRFSLSNAKNPLSSKDSGSSTQSAEVTGSGGSRGVDRERGAKGGANPALVPITLTAADVEQFKKEVDLK